jgi:hypothetical protein
MIIDVNLLYAHVQHVILNKEPIRTKDHLRDKHVQKQILQLAIVHDDIEVLHGLLLFFGELDDDKEYESAKRLHECLELSCEIGSLHVTQVLYHVYKVRDRFAWIAALTAAIKAGHTACIRFILDQGVCKSGIEHFTEAIWQKSTLFLAYLNNPEHTLVDLKSDDARNLILTCCHVDWVEGLDWLFRNGCQMSDKCTMYASYVGKPDSLRFLLDNGCAVGEEALDWSRTMFKTERDIRKQAEYKECLEILESAKKRGVVFTASQKKCCNIV